MFAIALLSATALAYEILLIRLFSVIQWHHFAYMIISLALLGYGASGTFLSLTQRHLSAHYATAFLTNVALFGLSLIPCFLLAQTIAFNPEEMLWDWRQAARLALVYATLSLPFFFAANAIALTFIHYRQAIARIYAVDLLGAGAGSLVILLLLFSLAPLQTLLVLAVCGLGCVAFAAWEIPLERKTALTFLTLALVAASLFLGSNARLVISPYKDLSQALQVSGAEVINEQSSPLSVLQVVESNKVPFRHAPGMSINATAGPPPQLSVFADGNSAGAITRNSGDKTALAYLDQLASALPYHLGPLQRVLVLGSGTGMDVLQALYQGALKVDAVELDPWMIELVKQDFTDFSGDLYSQPGVQVHIDDARGFIRSAEGTYDLIQLASQGASGAASAGLYALSENYLYTTEALNDYIDKLADDGYLLVNQWIRLPPRNTLKLLATAADALRARDIQQPGDYLLLIRGWQTATLLVKKTPFNKNEITAMRAFCQARSFDVAWYPGITAEETNRHNRLRQAWFHQAAHSLLGDEHQSFIDSYKFNIVPASDDRPYFNNFFKWSTLGEILALRDQGGMALLEAGYPVLLATLLQALLLSALIILLPLALLKKHDREGDGKPLTLRVLVYFGAIGLAFLFIEIALIQKFMLFLHHPLVAASAILASFLVFAGFGSYCSPRFRLNNSDAAGIRLPVLAILLTAIACMALLDPLFISLAGWPMAARILVSVLVTAPLAFFMGMPFPLALTALGKTTAHLIPLAWGINGCASVISAVLATVLAIHLGFTAVVVLALLLYLVAAASFPDRSERGGL